MSGRQMHLATSIINGLGGSPYAWTEPNVDPGDYFDIRAMVRAAQVAERGKLDFLFLGDFLAQSQQAESKAPGQTLEPAVVATAIAMATERIGQVNTVSTTYTEPFPLARLMKSLDVVSGGRIGWNAVTTSSPAAAANFGRTVEDRHTRYARAEEVIRVVEALWGSWQEGAWVADKDSRRLTDLSRIVPVNLEGRFVASRGPLEVPPSTQGQPIITHAGGSPHSAAFAGRHADVLLGSVFTIEESHQARAALRTAAAAAGRNPDTVKFIAGLVTTIADSHAEALARRGRLVEPDIEQHLRYLGLLIGLPLAAQHLDRPLNREQLAVAVPSPRDGRSHRALELAREGWTVREVLHHAVIDYHPAVVGRPEAVADHLQEWFEAEAADGFWIIPDVLTDGLPAFVDSVIPILQERGLFRSEYQGTTLREHLDVPAQYGPRDIPQHGPQH